MLTALLGAVKGTVSSAAYLGVNSAGLGAAYAWLYPTNQRTCTTASSMLQAHVDLSRLTMSMSSSFRVRAIPEGGLGDSGQVLSLAVADAVPS